MILRRALQHQRIHNTRAMSRISAALSSSPIPILTTTAEVRRWRADLLAKGRTVGFVPTMGALHQGHLDLVRTSIKETSSTIVSIYVNPAQFAPTEDLSSYPRTLPSDIAALATLLPKASSNEQHQGTVGAIFAPQTSELYPNGIEQDVSKQQGAFVEVAGLQNHMEGKSRPTFFRGVATVVTKLFHVVQPDLAYFGQKDIQQAMILRRLVSDLLFAYPPSASAVRVLPTSRAEDGLALSSRNVYLTPASRGHATALYAALKAAEAAWASSANDGTKRVELTLEAASASLRESAEKAKADSVHIEPLYVSLNDAKSLEPLQTGQVYNNGAILSGAAMIKEGKDGKATRLIDNLLLDFTLD